MFSIKVDCLPMEHQLVGKFFDKNSAEKILTQMGWSRHEDGWWFTTIMGKMCTARVVPFEEPYSMTYLPKSEEKKAHV